MPRHLLLRLYVNPAWRHGGLHTPLLNPWWGNPNEDVSLFAKEMFDTYQFDTSLYTVTDDLQQADLVLAPYKHQWFMRHDRALWEECVRTAEEAGLPLLVDGVGDVEYPVVARNAYILRIGGYRFLPEKGRIQVPPPSDDLLERVCGGQLRIRAKSAGKPVVGFAGWAKLSLKQSLRAFVKELPVRLRGVFDSRYRAMTKGVFWRRRAIGILQRSEKAVLNLRARGSFSGSAKTAEAGMRELRQQMVETILQSDYALEVRGDANDATRLFEILSLGRIPVIVDTERNFPFSDAVDYSSFALIVDFRDIRRLPEIVADFHARVTPERYEEMQKNARKAFVEYFRIDAQMRHIVVQLPRRASTT